MKEKEYCEHYDFDCKKEEMTCEGCGYYKKSADEMFKELGYKKNFEDKHRANYESLGGTIINFDKDVKTLRIYNNSIDIREFQAINKKVEELRMEIKTKYEIGQKVWVVLKNVQHKEIEIFSDEIEEIDVKNDKEIYYFLKELCDDIKEKNVILYEDSEGLLKKIIEMDKEFNTKEEK